MIRMSSMMSETLESAQSRSKDDSGTGSLVVVVLVGAARVGAGAEVCDVALGWGTDVVALDVGVPLADAVSRIVSVAVTVMVTVAGLEGVCSACGSSPPHAHMRSTANAVAAMRTLLVTEAVTSSGIGVMTLLFPVLGRHALQELSHLFHLELGDLRCAAKMSWVDSLSDRPKPAPERR